MTIIRSALQMVIEGVERNPDGELLTFVDIDTNGKFIEDKLTYRQLLDRARKMASFLKNEGLKEGDCFAVIMRNNKEFVEAIIASEIAGTIFVPIDPRVRGEKLLYMLSFANCKGALVEPELSSEIQSLLSNLPNFQWVWEIGSKLENQIECTEPCANFKPRPLADIMQLLYTSGTTGDPKAICSPYARFAVIGAIGPAIGLRDGDRLYTGLSLTHANAQIISLGSSLGMGLPLVISRQFKKSKLWEIVSKYKCTSFNLLGGMTNALLSEPVSNWEKQHKVRFVLSAGMPASCWNEFETRFGLKVFEFFGAAEGGLTLNPPSIGPIGSIGKPLPGTICAILDEKGVEVPRNTQGEICFRNADGTVSPVTYYNNAEASEAKTHGGWFHTGDIGHMDDEGWLWFGYRAGYSVRRNGDFIDTTGIETCIASMDGVTDVFVYGYATSDNAPGEKEVVAAIVSNEDFDPKTVFEFCLEKLGKSSVPSFVQKVNEIPKTASEKPQERFLIDMMRNGNSQVFNQKGALTL